jgi:hypothetical protein
MQRIEKGGRIYLRRPGGQLVEIEDVETKPTKRQSGSRFVRLPLAWVEQLAKARKTATWRLAAAHLLDQRFRLKGDCFRVSNVGAVKFGVRSRKQKLMALSELVELGLVSIEPGGGPGRTPLVSLHEVVDDGS